MIKIDVQGAEKKAVEGAGGLLGQTQLMLLEVSLFRFWEGAPDLYEMLRFMKSKGFVFYDLPGTSRRPRAGALGNMDVAFAPENGPLRASHSYS